MGKMLDMLGMARSSSDLRCGTDESSLPAELLISVYPMYSGRPACERNSRVMARHGPHSGRIGCCNGFFASPTASSCMCDDGGVSGLSGNRIDLQRRL